MICPECQREFKPNPKRPKQRFCSNRCRSAHHRGRGGLPGTVKSLRQLKDNTWNLIINYPHQPTVSVGDNVCMETE